VEFDPTIRPRQPGLHSFCVVVPGIIQKDMDPPAIIYLTSTLPTARNVVKESPDVHPIRTLLSR
jgi:hypothetical protein